MRCKRTFLLVLVFLWWLSGLPPTSRLPQAGEVIVSRDTKTAKVVPAEEGEEQEEVGPSKKRKVVRVELVQVIPIRKNNPFNPIEPIKNSDGKIVPPDDGKGEEPKGDDQPKPDDKPKPVPSNGNLLEGPNSIDYGVLFTGHFEASLDFNQNTGKFFLIPLSSDNSVLIVSIEDGSATAEFFTVSLLPDGTPFFNGPGGSVTPNTSRTIQITRSATGEKFQVTFTPGPPGTGLSKVSVKKI